jgi:SHS family lactate transporter-like MFS transporter
MLKNERHYSTTKATKLQCTGYVGGMCGGIIGGYTRQIFGRRFIILLLLILGLALIYPYTHSSGSGLYFAIFFEQFAVQGVFGIVPIHLMELAPSEYSAFIVGIAYNMGDLGASAVNTIESKIADRLPTSGTNNYAKSICYFMIGVFIFGMIMTVLGPEQRRELDQNHCSDSIPDNNSDDGAGLNFDEPEVPEPSGIEYDRGLWEKKSNLRGF